MSLRGRVQLYISLAWLDDCAAFAQWLTPRTCYAISSSGITEAIYSNWEYYEPIRKYGEPACIAVPQRLINVVDTILFHNNAKQVAHLKSAFGVRGFAYDNDFANHVSGGMGYWQYRFLGFRCQLLRLGLVEYCGNLTSAESVWPATKSLNNTVSSIVSWGGWANQSASLAIPMLNLLDFTPNTFLFGCGSQTFYQCWGTHNASSPFYTNKKTQLNTCVCLSWPHQQCTQWAGWESGSRTPKDQLPLVSPLLTPEYFGLVCKFAFNLTKKPDVDSINKYGGSNFS